MSTSSPTAHRTSTTPRPRSAQKTLVIAIAVVVALAAIGWGALTASGQLFRTGDRADSTFSGVTSLRIATDFESVEVVASPSATDVTVERTWTWSLREPATDMTQAGNTLTITSSCPFTPGPECRGHVRVVVPVATTVEASTGDGDVRLEGLAGKTTLDTADGAVRATALTTAELSVRSADGAIDLAYAEPPTSVLARSSDGNVRIEVPSGSESYRVEATTSDGARTVTVPTDPGSTRHIEVHTADGSILVTSP